MQLILVLLTFIILINQGIQIESFWSRLFIEKKDPRVASFMGLTKLKDRTFGTLTIKGSVEFDDLSVAKQTKITGSVSNSEKGNFGFLRIRGPFSVKNVTCNDLDVIGPVEATQLTVRGYASIIGPVRVKQSYFVYLDILSDKACLEDTEVDHIFVKKRNVQQVIHLEGKTVVGGDIRFESGKGIVKLDPYAKIQGTIRGATVEKI